MGSASGVAGMHKWWGDPRRRFAPSTPARRVVDAHRGRVLDFYGQILLWPPKYAHEWAVQAAWLGCKIVEGTPAVGLHPPHPVVASWTHTVRVVWTSMARYFYGDPSSLTNGQCKRPGRDAQMVGGPPPSVCALHTRWSRRGGIPWALFGLLWPDTSMATQVRARMGSASGVAGMQKCWGDPRRQFAPSTPAGRVVDAHRRRGLDFYGQILLWPPKYAHEWAVQAAWLECKNVGGTAAVGLHPPHPVAASWTHTVGVVWTSMARYFYGHPSTRTNGQCKRRRWDAQMLGGPPPSVCTLHTRWPRRGRTP